MRTDRPTYRTLEDALVAALVALDDVDLRHGLNLVSMGKFADPDAGFYFSLNILYKLGNTVDSDRMVEKIRDDQARIIREQRIKMVVEEYRATITRLAEREAAVDES